MKFAVIIFFLSVALLGNSSQAADAIEKFQENLKSVTAQACAPGTDFKSCDFKKTCQELAKKSGDLQLYADSDGRSIPNFAWMALKIPAEDCGLKTSQFAQANRLMNPIRQAADDEKPLMEKRIQENADLFLEVRSQMVAYLESLPISESQKTSMINRINSVDFRVITPGIEAAAEPECHQPNAFYQPDKHAIALCPQLNNMPIDSLRFVLLHELGHSIDPCALNFQLVVKDGLISPVLPDEFFDRTHPQKILAKAIPGSQNPFEKALKCMEKKNAKEFGTPSLNFLSMGLKEIIKTAKEMEGEDSQSAEKFINELDDLKTNYPDMKYCPSMSATAKPVEAFADWVATEVIAKQLKDNNSLKPLNPKLGFGVFYSACDEVIKSVNEKIQNDSPGKKCEMSARMTALFAESNARMASGQENHASSASRLSQIYLANPEIAKAVGCETRPQCKAF